MKQKSGDIKVRNNSHPSMRVIAALFNPPLVVLLYLSYEAYGNTSSGEFGVFLFGGMISLFLVLVCGNMMIRKIFSNPEQN